MPHSCPSCGNPGPELKLHDRCLTAERVGWMLHPFSPTFWQRVTVQAIAPVVVYVGPLPQRDHEVLRIHEAVIDRIAFVYVISSASFDVLYVGKTINPTGRLSSHRHSKDWWPQEGNLSLLAVRAEDRPSAEAAALRVEAIAIRDLRPIHNIAGVA